MLYVNGRFLTQKMTGVNRYSYAQCRLLQEQHRPFVLVCPRGLLNPEYDLKGMTVRRFGWGHSHFWAQLVLSWFFLFKPGARLICFMGLAPLLVRHTEMTIHDLAFLHYPECYSRAYRLFYRLMTPFCARHAEVVRTVSETSKKDILAHYPFLPESKVVVIPNKVDTTFFCPAETKREHFLLAVASMDPRKNFPRLVEAMQALPEVKLKIVGGTNRVFAVTQVREANNVEMLGHVTDEELRQLYRTAAGFVFPSLFEGYGLPPVEALACGCPVAVSDIPVLHETCDPWLQKGAEVLYFNPLDVESMALTMKKLLKR